MTKEDRDLILMAVQKISGRCDGAIHDDGVGFNGRDTNFGKSLARCEWLTEGQARPALKMVLGYPKQVGPELIEKLKAIQARETESIAQAATVAITVDVIKGMLQFGEPKQIETRAGLKLLSKAAPTDEFWKLWRLRKEDIKAVGISVGQDKKTGSFEVCLWGDVAGSESNANGPTANRGQEQPQPATPPAKVALGPETAQKLLKYQPDHVAALVAAIKAYGVAFDGSDTGTGKTFCALAVALEMGMRVWVLTPKAVIPSWKKAARLLGVNCIAINYEAVKTGKTGMGTWVKEEICGKKIEKFQWEIPEKTIVIFDEGHRCKAVDTQNCDLMIQARLSKAPMLILSATAASNPLEMRAFAYSLGLYNKPTKSAFYAWATRNGCVKGRFGFEFIGGKQAIRKIHDEIYGAGRGSRIRIADLPDFPKTQIFPTLLDFNGAASEIQGAYDEMERLLANLDEVEAKDRQGIILTEILRARQRAEYLKCGTIANMVEDAIAEGMSVAIFCNFDGTIDALAAKLKTDCVIRGGQKDDVRQHNIDRFQAGDFPRLALHCPTFSAQDMKQAFGRTHRAVSANEVFPSAEVSRVIICNIRAGGVGVSLHNLRGVPSIQKVVFAEGTIEERACEALERKIGNIDTLNDGDLAMGIKLLTDKHTIG